MSTKIDKKTITSKSKRQKNKHTSTKRYDKTFEDDLNQDTESLEDPDDELLQLEPVDDSDLGTENVAEANNNTKQSSKRSKKSSKETLEKKGLETKSAKEPTKGRKKKSGKEKRLDKKGKPTKATGAAKKAGKKHKPPKKSKKSITARKLPITGKAKKLPIEEVDDSVDIDWSFEGASEEDRALQDFEISQMEEKMQYIEREKMNLANELFHIKPDLDQKTKLIVELKKDYDNLRDDFDKYRKRLRKEGKEKQQHATEKLIYELLEVLDNFDRTNNLEIQIADKEDILKGVKIIQNQMSDILRKEGLKQIKAKGEPFDPYVHEAMSTTQTDDHPNNTVLEELQKGYLFKNSVLRASKVRVSQSDIRPAIKIKREDKTKEKKKEKLKKHKEKAEKQGKDKKKEKKKEKKIDKKELKKLKHKKRLERLGKESKEEKVSDKKKERVEFKKKKKHKKKDYKKIVD